MMMEKMLEKTKKIISLIGFDSVTIEPDEEQNKINVLIRDDSISSEKNQELVKALTHLGRLMTGTEDTQLFFDVNNYKRDREAIILKLARTAAKKAAVTKERVPLPPMNSYERMIIHNELSLRPDVETGSEGEAKERHVVVKPTEL
ncbi:MAG: hypothetical protein COT88_00625 [Candidatus Colwellbacteria bacterium CG10_big_fil_rev_8_21_14_0_10_41_28]|uniref:R3H domain-containing protein n=1 Tax=Candidatus Colwellbacteria bacterium CG10_big_fil_rev_8_21_14_0_10_41_28 TaxID=1974539 RepID=A0A2H0VHK5_9BACT|nr:MAG: hypothetical protein COT88_00625 [Candidatus Colwellbacteria bacterium CG10_big_fil_rev_8_21_14_0_10_41_28]